MALRELKDVNTKVRRLGYFPALLRLVQQRNLGEEVLLARFVAWGKEKQQDLRDYIDSTGDIVPSKKTKSTAQSRKATPYAAKRYLEFGQQVGWLTEISGMYSVTRIGRVLVMLNDPTLDRRDNNPFNLSLSHDLFFAYELWHKDGDILYALLHHIDVDPVPLRHIQKTFNHWFYEHLTERIQQTRIEYEHRLLLERRNNVESWKSPERYAEHIVPPRLHWLIDLGLVTIHTSSDLAYRLTPEGQRFKEQFSSLNVLTNEWLDANFFKAYTGALMNDRGSLHIWEDTEENIEVFNKWIHTAFKTFQRGSVAKLSFTQVVLFLCISLIVHQDIVVDKQDCLNILSTPIRFDTNHVIETRLSARENESYVILNPV